MNNIFIVLWKDPEDEKVYPFNSYYINIEKAMSAVSEDIKVAYNDREKGRPPVLHPLLWGIPEPSKWVFNDEVSGSYTIQELKAS